MEKYAVKNTPISISEDWVSIHHRLKKIFQHKQKTQETGQRKGLSIRDVLSKEVSKLKSHSLNAAHVQKTSRSEKKSARKFNSLLLLGQNALGMVLPVEKP